MIVPVVVEGQSLRWYGRIPEIADNSIEFVQLEFRFPEDWDNMVIVAQFTQTKTYNCLLVNNTCFLPMELVAGPCELSVFGYSGNRLSRGTSLPLRFNIGRSGFVSSAETPIPPTPDLYSQLMQQLADSEKYIDEKVTQVNQAAEETKTYRDQAQQIAKNLAELESSVNDTAVEVENKLDLVVELAQSTQQNATAAAVFSENAQSAAGVAENAAASAEASSNAAESAAQRAEAGAATVEYIDAIAKEAKQDSETAVKTANEANQKVETLREVVSKFHSNIVETAIGDVITVSDSSDMELAGLRIFGKTTQNGTPTPDAPVPLESVGDSGSVTVNVTGKNFFGGDALADKLVKLAKAVKNPEEKTVTYESGKVSNKVLFTGFKPNTQYTFFFYGSVDISIFTNLQLLYDDGTVDSLEFENGKAGITHYAMFNRWDGRTMVSAKGKTIKSLHGIWRNGNVTLYYNNCGIFEGVLTEADFKPYKDGGSLTIQKPTDVPVFLPGIPVTSGGNYTDETGQQWLCDEVDFEKGVYVQRVRKAIIDGVNIAFSSASGGENRYYAVMTAKGEFLNTAARPYCSYYQFQKYAGTPAEVTNDKYFGLHPGSTTFQSIYIRDTSFATADELNAALAETPMEVMYVLAPYKEYDLSAEELAQYATLHTNYPNTTIFNDAEADMEVKYVADTKLYVDKKFAELAQAMLSQ